MADTTIAGSVRVLDHSIERVAFDLMMQIARIEATPSPEAARDYYLKLFIQCHAAARGHNTESILKRI